MCLIRDQTTITSGMADPLEGRISATGCVAFAFKLGDAAFGNLPARMYAAGQFTFGKSVTTIGASAFKRCIALNKTLALPDGIKTIGASAFSGCNKVTTVTIGNTSKSSLTTIGKNTFNGCKKLSKVTIGSTKLSSVGKQAFKDTKSSLKVKVPSKQLTKYKKILKNAGLKAKQVTK